MPPIEHPLLHPRRRDIILSQIDGLETEAKERLSSLLEELEPHRSAPGVADLIRLLWLAVKELRQTNASSPEGKKIRAQLVHSLSDLQVAVRQLTDAALSSSPSTQDARTG